ncbi:MAG TPA: VOC family protein [Terracidiphilus sp.]|nr:VOC family protein [Terracidiphilus sp.]
MKLNAYLNFAGNCREALEFYEKHLAARIGAIMTFAEMPGPKNIPPGIGADGVLHARLDIAGTYVMASDVANALPMRSAYLSLSVDSTPEAERISEVLSEGGEVFMPMGETFFAHRFAMLRDKFGVNWMIIHEKPMC